MGLEPTRLLHPTRFPGELLSRSVNPPQQVISPQILLGFILAQLGYDSTESLEYQHFRARYFSEIALSACNLIAFFKFKISFYIVLRNRY